MVIVVLCVRSFACATYINFFLSVGVEILEGPSDFIVIPPANEAVFTCNVSEGALPTWRINGIIYLRAQQYPTGHVLDGIHLNVTMPANGSEYICLIIFLNGTAVGSDPGFLLIAGMYSTY